MTRKSCEITSTAHHRSSGRATARSSGIGMAAAFLALALGLPAPVSAQGGCGSVCIPLESLDPERAQLSEQAFRVIITTEFGRFDNFRVGDDDIPNPGGNRADLSSTSVFVEYGATSRLTLSLLLPYVNKEQNTNRFGERVAEGIGDIALFGRLELLDQTDSRSRSLAIGLGLKGPTGSIEEPGGGQPRLPPAFQAGSGAWDVIPTLSYFQPFGRHSLFGSSFLRIPLESNKFGYRFGQEFEVHFGGSTTLPIAGDRFTLLAALDYLSAEHDEDNNMVLPGRLRDGTRVLNTGGDFLDVSPGVRIRFSETVSTQLRAFLPIVEDWNGLASRNVGQVAPDVTYQLTVTIGRK